MESLKKVKGFLTSRIFQSVVATIIGSIIYSIGVVWLISLGKFFGGGVTGVSQIITTLLATKGINISMSIFVVALNVPLFIIGWNGVSKRFAILTLLSVVVQSITIFLFEQLDAHYGLNPFANFFRVNGVVQLIGSKFNRLELSLLGGVVCGIGIAINLKNGSSTGGVDIMAQLCQFKKGVSFGKISLLIDLLIITVAYMLPSGIGGIEVTVYTIIRYVISNIIVDKMHTTYRMVKVSIVSEKYEEMRSAIVEKTTHAVTIYEAIGGYSQVKKYVFESIVSEFQVEEYRKIARTVDPNCFISFSGIYSVDGKFVKKAIT